MKEFEGILHPLVTPFDAEGELDEPVLEQLAEHAIHVGVHGFFAFGSQGNGLAMRPDQRKRAGDLLVRLTAGRVPIVLQVGTVDTQTAVDLARHAEQVGADAVAVVPPFYYDHTEWEIIAHYRAVAGATGLPMFIYNNPRYSRIDIVPSLAAKIAAELPSVVAIKESYGSLDVLIDYLRVLPPTFRVFSGGLHLVPALHYGVRGAINPPASVFPELCVRLYEAAKEGRYDDALALQDQVHAAIALIADYTRRFGRGVYREILRLQGFEVQRFPRWETRPLTSDEASQLRADLDKVGVGRVASPA